MDLSLQVKVPGSNPGAGTCTVQVLCALLDFNPSPENTGSEMVKTHRTGTGSEDDSNNSISESSNQEESAARRSRIL